ncbi:MATE efflux family protein, partial [Vibrio parahaemolyticus EKP-028]
ASKPLKLVAEKRG